MQGCDKMIRFEDQIKRCSELLYQLCDDVQRLNNLNYFDMNITCEYFYIHLLNCIFGWNLRNENFTQKNASTIDLVDNDNRIAIQVTSNKSVNKIHNTLKSFRETKLYEKYDRLIFIVIVKKKSYSANFETDIQGAFLFDEKSDIYTMDKLIRKIQDLGYQKVADICEYLEFELGIVKDPKRVWTISAAFQDISDSTNGFLNEDFFEIDDYRFKDRFKIELERKPIEIHINGSDKEETMYCILNHIHTLISDKQIYIIRDEQSWIAAKNRLIDSIVIPFFAAAQIPALQGNINIFIHGAQKHHKNGLELRRRTRSFLNLKLQKNQYPDAHILIKNTSGIYYFLKKELYQGDIESPAWGQDKHIAVISSIMVGSWCQSNNDWQVLETVAQKPYSEIIEYLEKYINGETPLILKKRHNNQVSYELADPEISWCEIKDSITDDLMNRFLSAIKLVLSGCKNHSGLLIKGMLRTMIFLAIHNYKQSAIDRCVEEILSGIKTTNEWNCIANHMVALCEASPKAIISRLQDGLHDNSGLLDLFVEDVSAISWEGSNYIQILWAVEMLLGHKQYAICAIRWLMELSNYVEKCSSGNNPRDTISKVFCIYYNNVAISVPDKIYLAEEGLKKYCYIWDILFEQLPFITSFSIVPTQEFSYREDDGIGVKELSWSEINQQRLAFYNLLFNKIGSDIEKWLKILQLFPHITDQMLNDAIDTLMTELKAMHDSDRERIQYKLREIIYEHRFFIDADWSVDEKRITQIETFCKSISFDESCYKYLYLTRTNDFPFFNPKPFSDKGIDRYYSLNQEKRKRILQEEFVRFKKEKIDLACFLQIVDRTKLYGIGYMIAEYYSGGKFSEETLIKMLTVSGIGEVISDYIRWCYYHDTKDIFSNALKIIDGYDSSCKLYYGVLQIPPVDYRFLEMLDQLPHDTQKGYWASSFGIQNLSSPDIIILIMPKLFEYKLWKKAIQITKHFKEKLTINQLMEYLDKILDLVDGQESYIENMTIYEVKELVAYIEGAVADDYAQYSHLLKTELTHIFVIGWDHAKCIQHHIKKDARLFATILSKENDIDNKDQMRYRRLYDTMHFCPGEIDGQIDRTILKEWIETFQICLEKQHQEDMFYTEIGRLFAYSPIGADGIMPHEAVRDMIELYSNDHLLNSYLTSTFNQRGAYPVTYGESEYRMASNYKSIADKLRLKWPKTAEIYDELYRIYDIDSRQDRIYGEDY